MKPEYYRDETGELWLIADSTNYEIKTPATYRQTPYFITFRHDDPTGHTLRRIEKRDLNYLELDNVESFLHELEDWLEREKMRKSSLVYGKTERVLLDIQLIACGLYWGEE